jgi:tryptophan synthase beta chain
MELLGAKVVSVTTGARTLKDAINEAFRDWMASVADTHYCIGSVMGPHPFPVMVRDFQSVVGREVLDQMPKLTGRPPDVAVACVGGGSNAAGLFYPLLETDVQLIGVEAAGRGLIAGQHAATLTCGRPGVLHGMSTYVLQDDEGQTAQVHSVSAGLDYPGVGPEHSAWKESGRVRYETATDAEAIDAFLKLSRLEGIIPALESAHAVAFAMKLAATMPAERTILVNLSGRGDKDCVEVARITGEGEF